MAFSTSYPDAARRNLSAADVLSNGDRARRTVAGYLYGLAAECALKQIGSGSLAVKQGPVDAVSPLMSHFPELKTLLRDHLRGRMKADLRLFIENDRFMRHWDIRVRYARVDEIDDRWIDDWKEQARDVVDLMNSYG
jgi:hypothetical protein